MRLILIVPYNWPNQHLANRELVNNMRKNGQLEGIEIDFDDGLPFPEGTDMHNRGPELYDYMSYSVAKRVRHFSDTGKYDAIVATADQDPGFFAGRTISKVPFITAGFAGCLVASLIGERFTFLAMGDGANLTIRRFVRNYGFDDKLVSVRSSGYSRPDVDAMSLIIDHPNKEERFKLPEVKKIVDGITGQCIAAIEKDRADSLIFGCSFGISVYEELVRKRLDEAGYSEIPIIVSQYAAVEMAKAMVNMKLIQARRAYPGSELKTKPEFR